MLKKMHSILLGSLMLSSASTVMAMGRTNLTNTLAFASVLHPRLGDYSLARVLPANVIQDILANTRHQVTVRNRLAYGYIVPTNPPTHEHEIEIALRETLFFRIRDFTGREDGDRNAPIVWEGPLAKRADHVEEQGAFLPTEQQIEIPGSIHKIRIAVVKADTGQLINYVTDDNVENLQEIETFGRLGRITLELYVTFRYRDNRERTIQIFRGVQQPHIQ